MNLKRLPKTKAKTFANETPILSSRLIVQKTAGMMLDTVRIEGRWRAKTKLPERRILRVADGRGVRIRTDEFGTSVVWAECSLPRLLLGHNGWLLENQDQLTHALKKFHALLSDFAHVPDVGKWKASRLDTVWNFDLPPKPYIFAHFTHVLPGIKGKGTLWNGGDSVTWKRADSNFKVQFYDKALKMRVPGSVLRVEISLSDRQLHDRIGRKDWREFSSLYSVYRDVLVIFPPILPPLDEGGWPEALGPEQPEIRHRILGRMTHKCERTQRAYWHRTEAAAANLPAPFSWATFLPVEGPPPAVHVKSRKERDIEKKGSG